jgi:hypothetical protein
LCGPDPIYAAIERHKAAGVVWDAAVDVRSRFNNLHMDDERRKQLAVLENAVDEAWEHCEQAGVDLINTGPLLRYRDLEGLLEELALVSDVCKTLFEFEMTKAKTMAERLGGDLGPHQQGHRRPAWVLAS